MNRITKWISLIERCGMQYRSAEFVELGFSPSHHMYILYLCNHPGVSQEMLTKMLHINKSNVARSLKVLQDTGYIYKEINIEDKRVYHIFPTEKAYQIKPKLVEKMKIWNEILMAGLSEEENKLLFELLKKIALQACEYTNKEYVEAEE